MLSRKKTRMQNAETISYAIWKRTFPTSPYVLLVWQFGALLLLLLILNPFHAS